MKNLSKVLAVVLAFAMALSMVSFAAFTDVKAGDNYEEAINVLSGIGMLKGYEDGSFGPEKTITRAEFATVVIRLLGLGDAAPTATMFDDVAADHWASGYIALASQQGIVNGYGDGKFGPEDPVKYNEAIKMVVAALGYTPMADANGGWPGGFQVVAAQKGILAGISGVAAADEAPRGVVAQLAYNALTVPLMEQTGFGTNISYETVGSLLLNKLGITKFEGAVTATSLSSNLKEGKIKVKYDYQVTAVAGQATAKKYNPADATMKLYCNPVVPSATPTIIATGDVEEAAKGLIDVASVMYVKNADSDKAELVCIVKDGNKNETFEFMTEDLKANANLTAGADTVTGTIEVYTDVDAGDYEEYYLNVDKVYVNGRTNAVEDIGSINAGDVLDTVAEVEAVLEYYLKTTESADVKLLSRVEEEYNVAYITVYDDVKVTGISPRSWKVTFEELPSNASGKVILDETDKDLKFEIYKDGELASFEDIKEDDVLSIAGYINGNDELAYGIVYIISDRVEGKVTGRSASGNKLAIDGTTYKATGSALTSVAVGDTAVFFKNYRGILVAADTTAVAANTKYGFASYARAYDADYGEPAHIRLLTAEGKWETILVADTFSVNGGARQKSKDYVWGGTSDLVTGSSTKYGINKVIAYDLNAEGKIQKLYLANTTGVFEDEGITAGLKRFDADTLMFGDEFMDDNTVIFSLDGNFEGNKNYDTDEDEVTVVAISSLVDGAEHQIDVVYDIDDEGYVGAILGRYIAAGIDYAADFFVVTDDAMQSTNAAGETGVLLTGIQGGEEVTLFINEEDPDCTAEKAAYTGDGTAVMAKNAIATINDTTFGKGDVLLYTLNAKDEAAKVLLLLDASDVATSTSTPYGKLSTIDATTGSNTTIATIQVGTTTHKFIFGYAEEFKDKKLSLKATGNAPVTPVKAYAFDSNAVGTSYDAYTGTGKVTEAMSGDITYDPAGDNDGDMVFARVIGSRIVEFAAIANEE